MTAVNTTAHNAQSAMRGSSCPCWPLKFRTVPECILGTCRCRNTKRFHLQRRFYFRPSILNSMKRRMQWPTAYHSQRSTDGMTTKRGRACVCLLPDFNGNLSKFVHIQNFQLADAQQCSDHDFLPAVACSLCTQKWPLSKRSETTHQDIRTLLHVFHKAIEKDLTKE